MGEQVPVPERPRMNDAQRAALQNLCTNFSVEFDEADYYVYADNSWMMPGWCEGWLGGQRHANPQYGTPEEPRGKPTIYVGCSPEGECHS